MSNANNTDLLSTLPSLDELKKEYEQSSDPAAFAKFQRKITDIYAKIDEKTQTKSGDSKITQYRKRMDRVRPAWTGPFVKISPAPPKDSESEQKSDTKTKESKGTKKRSGKK